MTAITASSGDSPATEKPVAFGYISLTEPDEVEIAQLRRRIGRHCRSRDYHLATVFCDRGFESADMARPGFAGLLDALWPSNGTDGGD